MPVGQQLSSKRDHTSLLSDGPLVDGTTPATKKKRSSTKLDDRHVTGGRVNYSQEANCNDEYSSDGDVDDDDDQEKDNQNQVSIDNRSSDRRNSVEDLKRKVRDLEARLKIEQQKPPSMIVCKAGNEHPIDRAALEKMAEHDVVLVNNLKIFAKKTVFPACKFLTNRKDAITLCRRAVRLRKVILPVGVSETDFCNYYQGKMKSLIDKFRNTTQYTARDNYMSKLSISFGPAAPHHQH